MSGALGWRCASCASSWPLIWPRFLVTKKALTSLLNWRLATLPCQLNASTLLSSLCSKREKEKKKIDRIMAGSNCLMMLCHYFSFKFSDSKSRSNESRKYPQTSVKFWCGSGGVFFYLPAYGSWCSVTRGFPAFLIPFSHMKPEALLKE